MSVRETAPAKINLALHVTGQRENNGYHELESLVTFSRDGDTIEVSPADVDGFSISGRFGEGLSHEADGADGNLVLKARDAVRAALVEAGEDAPPVHIHLEKNLPVAAGIGGGSADAAAAIRALLRHWNSEISAASLDKLALQLGADLPMCLTGKPLLATGIGENIAPLGDMPSFHLVLANPLQPVSTPQVFRGLANKNNPVIGHPPVLKSPQDWIEWMSCLRNDLEPPARRIASRIAELCGLLKDSGGALVRMSGSGASCFAIYENAESAKRAFETLQAARPDWYFMLTETKAGNTNHAGH